MIILNKKADGNDDKQYQIFIADFFDFEKTEIKCPCLSIFAKNEDEAVKLADLILYRRHNDYKKYHQYIPLPRCGQTVLIVKSGKTQLNYYSYVGRVDFPAPTQRSTSMKKHFKNIIFREGIFKDINLSPDGLKQMIELPDYTKFYRSLYDGKVNIDDWHKNDRLKLLGM